ncbi:LysR family transcriptional regulator [Paludibacterium purpuratum]|uniref:DNA-binding transcriptional LysR family regulator n=1 Tax=Paludibacterium purpuratum TaxID=1144873 RepID=A0A4R7B8M4_9NEIS|nr:LysR family transcriptional regulator [Paludibacterium purpuratum]TDR80086.1 DNA-binding transcriptional LysR family regulator [Paludibacterium purpuratum]
MSISLADLALLIDVAELGSFSQAAARRGWSQPQVSQRIAVLETELGQALFRRHRRGAVATAACEVFLVSARQAVQAFQQGQEALLAAPPLPRVHLSCLPSLTTPVFGPLLLRLADAPFEIRCHTDHSPQIMQAVLTGEIDVGFVLKCPAIAGVQVEPLWRSAIVPVVAADHPLARAPQPLTLKAVADYRIAPQFWGSGCEELIRRIWLVRQHRSAIHAIQPASAARDLALSHGFLSFLPELSVRFDLQKGSLVKLQIPELPEWQWEVMMAYRSGKRKAEAKQIVLDSARALAAS